jgi:hypothetical protein
MVVIVFYLFGPKVVDCRVCGDPNSILRFAFIEFTDEGMIITCCTLYTFTNTCLGTLD